MGGEASGCDAEHHRRADRIGAVGAAQHRADRPQARHQLGRALPLRARRRSELHAAGARARDRRWCSSSAAARRRRSRSPARPRRRSMVIDFPTSELKRLAGLDLPLPEMRRVLEQARLPRRRPGPAREGRRAVVAARHRGQGRHRRGDRAHRRRRPHSLDAVRPRRGAAQAGADRRCRCAPARPSARSPRAAWSRR